MDIVSGTKFDFMGKRKIAFTVSIILAVVGIIAAIAIPLGKAKLGIDFSGGVSIQYRFEKPFSMDVLRDALKKSGFDDAEIQEISGTTKVLVRTKQTGDLKATGDAMGAAFKTALPDNPFIVDSTTAVGPTVGRKLQKDALWAVIVSLIGILIYVAWRFEFRFGVAAVIATLHDVLAVLAIFFVLNKEINLMIITALLTLAGYSLTDTVVVFDRIRESLRKTGGKEEFIPLINRSINEVLSRTLVTSVTVLLVLLALLLVGGEVIHDFAFALFIGVIIGTYSSIFVASPILLFWEKKGAAAVKAAESQS